MNFDMAPRANECCEAADVCLVVEGCYPYISGGVSNWINWLIKSQEHLTFSVVAIVAGAGQRQVRYERPANLVTFQELNVSDPATLAKGVPKATVDQLECASKLAEATSQLIAGGGAREFAEVLGCLRASKMALTLPTLLNSPVAWNMVQGTYRTLAPNASFLQFFWAWRALVGGLFAVASFQLPKARTYHAVSTGYAGLLAARTRIETGCPTILTEHGIYTSERRIEIMMARWLSDTIEKGLAIDDERRDVRDIWIDAFDSYARCCYEASSFIVTLFTENQELQRSFGAEPRKLSIIPNGIDVSAYKDIGRPTAADRPTMALIGRVVSIKDVKTYIAAAAVIREHIPDIRALVMGPTDEEPSYFAECIEMVEQLRLEDCVIFTGNVRLSDYLSSIHVVVLTSVSEAQPLVLLEAGAAGIPCVTTNVGCCKDLLLGAPDEVPNLGKAGYVTDVLAPDQTAAAVVHLLRNQAEQEAMGNVMRSRIASYYTLSQARQSYSELYEKSFSIARFSSSEIQYSSSEVQ